VHGLIDNLGGPVKPAIGLVIASTQKFKDRFLMEKVPEKRQLLGNPWTGEAKTVIIHLCPALNRLLQKA
jgi:hypothetical protein